MTNNVDSTERFYTVSPSTEWLRVMLANSQIIKTLEHLIERNLIQIQRLTEENKQYESKIQEIKAEEAILPSSSPYTPTIHPFGQARHHQKSLTVILRQVIMDIPFNEEFTSETVLNLVAKHYPHIDLKEKKESSSFDSTLWNVVRKFEEQGEVQAFREKGRNGNYYKRIKKTN